MPNVSLICTVLNEEKTIGDLLQSISDQTRIPNEVIIVDGGSTDRTVSLLKKAKKKFPQLKLTVVQQQTNRSEGRNLAIKKARYDTIAITDAGCVLDPQWLEELVKKQLQTGAEVIAGYYRSEPKTPFQEAVVPFTLVMPDKVDPLSFLPATRSMLIKKSVFDTVGYFDPSLLVSEDYEFAHRLKKAKVAIMFAREATVVWSPRKNVGSFFRMVVSMAAGDVTGGVVRPKVVLVFIRYIFFATLLLGSVTSSSVLFFFLGVLAVYSVWALWKNHHYVSPSAYPWLIGLQYLADIGVIWGTLSAFALS